MAETTNEEAEIQVMYFNDGFKYGKKAERERCEKIVLSVLKSCFEDSGELKTIVQDEDEFGKQWRSEHFKEIIHSIAKSIREGEKDFA